MNWGVLHALKISFTYRTIDFHGLIQQVLLTYRVLIITVT